MPLLKKLARAPLIIVDDLGIASVTGKLYREFLEMLDDRQGQGATPITSQFPVNQWHKVWYNSNNQNHNSLVKSY